MDRSSALVTGATSGIGAGFARRLAADGYDLVLVARDVERLDTMAADLTHRFGSAVEVLSADLGDPHALVTVEARLADPQRPIDMLINNAGYSLGSSFLATSSADLDRQLDVLVRATLRLTRAALPGMVERGSGSVINVSSVAGWLPTGPYAAAKSWVTSFTAGLATELKGSGVSALLLAPGFVKTEFHQRADLDMSRFPDWAWLDVDPVVDTALGDLRKGRTVSVPGLQYKVAATLARHLPASAVGRLYYRHRRPR